MRNNLYLKIEDIVVMCHTTQHAEVVHRTIQSSCRAERRNNLKNKKLKQSVTDLYNIGRK